MLYKGTNLSTERKMMARLTAMAEARLKFRQEHCGHPRRAPHTFLSENNMVVRGFFCPDCQLVWEEE